MKESWRWAAEIRAALCDPGPLIRALHEGEPQMAAQEEIEAIRSIVKQCQADVLEEALKHMDRFASGERSFQQCMDRLHSLLSVDCANRT